MLTDTGRKRFNGLPHPATINPAPNDITASQRLSITPRSLARPFSPIVRKAGALCKEKSAAAKPYAM